MKRLFLLLSVLAVMAHGQTITVTGTPLTAFGNVAINTNSAEQSFSISAAGLAEFDEFVLNAPSGFEISTTSGSGFTTSVNVGSADQLGDIASTTIYVRFSPTSTGAASGNITVAAGAAPTQNVAVSGSGIETEPSTAASSITFTPVRATTIKINWTNGNGANRIVVVRATSAVDFTPSDATTYTANTNFALGTAVGTACKVVYNGSGTSTVVTNLSASTTYHIAIFEYNGSTTTINYGSGATGNQATTAATALTGPTYTVGTDGDFPTLSGAVQELNTSGVGANLTFYIVSDITESANIGLGVNTNGNSVTIRPSADVDRTLTFTSTTDNTGPSGHFVIGNPTPTVTWTDANTISTNNVTINGYAEGGTTRRLKFTNATASTANARLITIVGGCQNTVVKNCIFENKSTSGTSPVCIVAVVRKGTAIDVAPDSLVIDNNLMTATASTVGMGMRLTNSGTPTTTVTKFHFRNNQVTAQRRLLEINYTNGAYINNNEFTTNQTGVPGTVSYGVWTQTGNTGTFYIHSNKFLSATTSETGAFGHRCVSLASTGTYHIYNNMFSGLNKTAASSVGLNLTYLFYSGVSGTIYNNSFYMPALSNASSTGYYSSIQLSGNTATIKNNIFVSDEATHSNVYFISTVPTPVPDYNNYYIRQAHATHKVVSTYTSVAAYQSANPTKDINAKNIDVVFTSATNLKLAGGSIGNTSLAGASGLGITTDFEGDARNMTAPYIGADEASTALPVELTAFTAVARGKNVDLQWTTATEQNNLGFDVERMVNGAWSRIGFVQGAGTSNAPKEYRFTDAGVANGTVLYRLKQVDVDGKFTYHNAIEVVVNAAVTRYELSQNYPNPFNPTTSIRFAVPTTEQATVKVYDMTGREVAELFNQVAAAGQIYNVQFTGTGLASGIYLYVLQTQSYREVKKMSLLK